MVAFGHTGVGVIVGIVSYQAFGRGDIALGLVATGFLGVLSHYIMDSVPHGHFFRTMEKYERLIIWVILLDLLLPIIFLLVGAHFFGKSGQEILYVLFGIGGAQLPDVLDGLKRIKLLPSIRILEFENRFHMSTHWHGKEEKALLFTVLDVWQIAVLVIAAAILFYY